jgi:hypothetical protein
LANPNINQPLLDLPHFNPDDRDCMVLKNISNKPTSTKCEHPEASSTSIMNHCERLKSVKTKGV